MRNRISLVLALGAALALAACATVPDSERKAACQATDWHAYGRNDGLLGIPAAERIDHFNDCAALGFPADTAAYQAGRAEGLREYCTVENGYEVGFSGRRYRGVCPPELEPGFRQGFDEGRKERRRAYPYDPYFGFGIGYGRYPGWWGGYYGFPGWWYRY